MEYIIISISALNSALLLVKLRRPQPFNIVLLFGATCTMAMGELFFTLYTTMTGVYNVLGHIYKVISYYFIYRAIVVETIDAPYNAVRKSKDQLNGILENAPIGMAITSADGHITFVNPP